MLVGNYRCGKTSIWNRIFGGDFHSDKAASDMMNCREVKKALDNGRIIQFNIWDTAGAKEYYEEVVNFSNGASFVL